MLKLSPRLSVAASLIRGGTAADIGTDHGYLAAWLVMNGKVPACIAADIGVGPLKNAEKTLIRYGITQGVELRLSDGLKNFSEHEVSEIIICGMGGTLISDILSVCPWVKSEGIHLILQPMTHIEDVRKYLSENGFSVEKEISVFDENRYYITLSAVYDGNTEKKEIGWYYFGDTPFADDGFCAVTKKQFTRLKKRLDSLRAAERFPDEQACIEEALLYYERMG